MGTVVAPILGFVFLMLETFFGISFGEGEKAQIVEGIVMIVSAAVTLYGIFKSHSWKKKDSVHLP